MPVERSYRLFCLKGGNMIRKIGFLGPEGTFTQEALEKYAGNSDYKKIAFNTTEELLTAATAGDIDEAVVPIENSIEGSVNRTLDMLSSEVDLKIRAEEVIPITQNLLAKKGTAMSDIKYLFSHPQAIGQCNHFISKKLPGVDISYSYSTSSAAIEASSKSNCAAIASASAAKAYSLDIIAAGIQDNDSNVTRFVVLSKEDSPCTGKDKTSIVFSTEDKPGSLYRILDIFNLWDINMTRIESRPAKLKLGRYIFFVDIEGHRCDENINNALMMVKRKTSFYKFLGSYPRSGV
jgi:prephenate dehydratase